MILIKVESLNIYDFVYAAQDLSAIRGASLSLLEMPKRLKAWLKEKYPSVQEITSGASNATFSIEDNCVDPEEIERQVQKWLNSDCPYATVGAACAKLGAKYFDTEEALLAKIRNKQMKSFSFAGLVCEEAASVCSFDRVRPATTHKINRGTESYVVSKEVYDLHKYGLDRKQKFLHEHAGLGGVPYTYTWDLDKLATNENAGTLNRKMAIFYADGNNFGSLLREALSTQDSTAQQQGIKTFDDVLQGKRKEFLKQLLESATSSRWQTTTGERRIELLLWGGDELMIVVPAWCGWEVAELFASVMNGVSVRIGNRMIPLKHAMSLVFSHYKAPIHALAKLASQLANDEAKNGKTTDAQPGRATNRLSYLVLESFDHIGEDLKRFRMLLCPDEDARKGLVLSAEDGNLKTIRETMATFKGTEFPRRKVYEAVLGLSHGTKWDELKKTIEPFVQKKNEWKRGLKRWQDSTGGMLSSWYHLAELWDYLEPDVK
jgi:hypothetical protein